MKVARPSTKFPTATATFSRSSIDVRSQFSHSNGLLTSRRKELHKCELLENNDSVDFDQMASPDIALDDDAIDISNSVLCCEVGKPSPIRRQSSSSSLSTESTASSSGVSSGGTCKGGRDILAQKLRQNWLEKSAQSKEILDDSLTNLNWLHNLNSAPLESAHIEPISSENSPLRPLHLPGAGGGGQGPSGNEIKVEDKDEGYEERADYRMGTAVKPPFSYASLICMAMRELGKSKITLSDIYNWITDNFIYYRLADTSWQNSVRHNLSLNKCFEKVPRRKDEPGKGGFWRINAKYAGLLENGLTRRRSQQSKQHQFVCPPLNPNSTKASSVTSQSGSYPARHSGGNHYAPSYSSNLVRSQHSWVGSHQRLLPSCNSSMQMLTPSPPSKRSRYFKSHYRYSTDCDERNSDSIYCSQLTSHLPAVDGPSTSSYYCYPRRRPDPPHHRWPHPLAQYRTAETNDRVDTQMRHYDSLHPSPLLSGFDSTSSASSLSPPHSASSSLSPPTSASSSGGDSVRSSADYVTALNPADTHRDYLETGDPLHQMFLLVDGDGMFEQADPLGQRLEDVLNLEDTSTHLPGDSGTMSEALEVVANYHELTTPLSSGGESSTLAGEEFGNWSPTISRMIR